MSYSVAVAGASGYAGGEILRLLADHPQFTVSTVTAFSNAGQSLWDVHPQLRGLPDLTLAETTVENLKGHDVVFFALPHGKSGELTAGLGEEVLVVDCGADHRLTEEADWLRFYGSEYHGAWPYGLPELPVGGLADAGGGKLRSTLPGVKRIAVPGCNVTAVSLALAPALAAALVEPEDLGAVLAVGVSGAGKALHTHLLASEILGSAAPYAVGGVHRHIPEIQQNLALAGGAPVTISFTPVLVPMARGILATCTARLAPGADAASLRAAYESVYGDEPSVQLLPEGRFPKTADVLGANVAQLGIAIDADAGRLVAISAIDNLTKGTAGAAIQSANIALGLDEFAGLKLNGTAP